MSVFIPQEWIEEDELDLRNYATKTELLSYLQKETDGTVDLGGKRVSNLAPPVDGGDAVNKQYIDAINTKPVICITGEAVGNLTEYKHMFSFGAKSHQYADRNNGSNANNGIVMPVAGKLKYFTVCTTNTSGSAPRHNGLNFAVQITTSSRISVEPMATILAGNKLVVKQFSQPYTIGAGDIITFYCLTNSPNSFITIASAFIELDI